MLEGLEASEVWLSESFKNKDFRMDSDFWTKQPKKNLRLKYKKIGDILKLSQYGISVSMNENNRGFPIYRMNEIHNMLCDLSVDKYADISTDEFQDFELQDRDVLFNRTNSFEWVGRTGVYYQNDGIPKTFASYLVRFNPDENVVLPEYLATFLSSKHGVWDVKRRARQSINQTNVNPEEVKEIDIPILPMEFQKEIRNRFEKANKNRVLSHQIYHQAEELLLETIGLKDFKPSEQGTNIKSFKDSFLATGRLDAEHYLPKYEEVRRVLMSHKGGFDVLGKLCNTYRGNFVEEYFYTDNNSGYAYIRGADISSNIMITDKMTYLDEKFVRTNERLVQKGDIVMALIGSVGTAALVIADCVNSIISNNLGFIRINNQQILPEFLHLLLTHKNVGGLLFAQQEMRTAQPKISDKDIHNFPIPLVDIKIQQQIAALIEESFYLRAESERLLSEAKEMVEGEIEGENNKN